MGEDSDERVIPTAAGRRRLHDGESRRASAPGREVGVELEKGSPSPSTPARSMG